MKHKLYLDYILDGNLFLAPIGDYPQKIVDLGTGVGFWATDGLFYNFDPVRNPTDILIQLPRNFPVLV